MKSGKVFGRFYAYSFQLMGSPNADNQWDVVEVTLDSLGERSVAIPLTEESSKKIAEFFLAAADWIQKEKR